MFGPLIELIDCQSVYNILNEGIEFSKLSDRYYLYLLGKSQLWTSWSLSSWSLLILVKFSRLSTSSWLQRESHNLRQERQTGRRLYGESKGDWQSFDSFWFISKNDDEHKSFRLPYEAELESCNMVVIYDSNTSNLNDNGKKRIAFQNGGDQADLSSIILMA